MPVLCVGLHGRPDRECERGWLARSLSFFNLGPGAFERDGSIEDELAGRGIGVGTEVSYRSNCSLVPGETEARQGSPAGRQALQRMGIHVLGPVLVGWNFRGIREHQTFIEPDFGIDGM